METTSERKPVTKAEADFECGIDPKLLPALGDMESDQTERCAKCGKPYWDHVGKKGRYGTRRPVNGACRNFRFKGAA